MRWIFLTIAVAVAMPVGSAAILQVPSATFPTIASAVAVVNMGDTIRILPGTYHEPLVLMGSVGVTVVGKGKVVLDVAGLMNGIVLTNVTSVSIENLIVRHSTSRGVLITGASQSKLRKLRVEHSGDDGIKTSASDTLQIIQCVTEDCNGDGFDLVMDGGIVTNCFAETSQQNGLRLNGVGNVVKNSTFDLSTQNGVFIGSDVNSSANSLANLKLKNSTGSGLAFGTFASGNLVRNSTITKGGIGVSIGSGADFNSIANVVVASPAGDGFSVAADHCIIEGCVVKKSGDDAFVVLAAGGENLFSNDVANHAFDIGFEVAGTDNSFVHVKAIQCPDPVAEVGNPANFYLDNNFPAP